MNMQDLKKPDSRNRDEVCGYQREGMEGVVKQVKVVKRYKFHKKNNFWGCNA